MNCPFGCRSRRAAVVSVPFAWSVPFVWVAGVVATGAFGTPTCQAAVFAEFDASRHERFLGDGTANPGFLVDHEWISGVAVSPGVLITPLHYLSATHIGAGGENLRFRGSDGVIRDYVSESSVRLTTNLPGGGTAASDLQLHRLQSPIPAEHGVRPLALFGGSIDSVVGREFVAFGAGNQAGRNVVDDVVVAEFTGGSSPSFVVQYSFDTATNGGVGGLGGDEIGLIGGDSGSAAILRVGEEFAVIGTHFGIDTSDGQSPEAGDRYDSFSALVTPYLPEIDSLTSADGYSISVIAVPEAGTWGFLAVGCAAMIGVRVRRVGRRAVAFGLLVMVTGVADADRPNILIAISDDQSYPHASAYGAAEISTPAFDRVAREGVLFRQAFTPAPGCSPMRAAFLTGREIWQIGPAGTHASSFPGDLPVFTTQLAEAGYHVGMTGKGWGPGNFRIGGWEQNPAGKSYGARKIDAPPGIRNNDYAGNFADFLEDRDGDEPFCFWYGASEPHRGYHKGIGAENGIDPGAIAVPGFLPDSDEVRGDIADYYYEIQWFDRHLGRMLKTLEDKGELDNTLVIVTSDNGMPFPRAKANLYEYGIHMPLAISWPAKVSGGRVTDELVSLLDVTRTIFDVAEVTPEEEDRLAGVGLLPMLRGERADGETSRDFVASGRERHSSSRYHTLGYPCRAIRTDRYLYIRNFTPERWPAGAPQKYDRATFDDEGNLVESRLGDEHGGYHDIDNGPTLRWMIAHRDDPAVAPLFAASVDRRPAEEFYDVREDPACLNNLADVSEHAEAKARHVTTLTEYLTRTGDLRQTDPDAADVWETYPRFSPLRWFPVPDWAKQAPELVPDQPWLEARRPRE